MSKTMRQHWEETHIWLKDQGLVEEFGTIQNELLAIRCLILSITTDDEPEKYGAACLLETISNKIGDISRGRMPYELLS